MKSDQKRLYPGAMYHAIFYGVANFFCVNIRVRFHNEQFGDAGNLHRHCLFDSLLARMDFDFLLLTNIKSS